MSGNWKENACIRIIRIVLEMPGVWICRFLFCPEMRYSESMTDVKKKLDGLAAQLGMIPAKDLPRGQGGRPENPHRVPDPPDDSVETKTPNSTGVLSSELAGQLCARLGLQQGQELSRSTIADSESAPEVTSVLPGEIIGDEAYGFFLYRRTFPCDFPLGEVPLGVGLSCDGRQIALSACDDNLRNFDPQKTCYVDTETTGLAGGAGTVAFLIGLGYFRDESFTLDQCFMRDYDDEGPMLAYLAERFGEFDCVVSYNGKSFDLPLLRTRFVQHRIPSPFTNIAHYDLVHAARRVWKKRLSDCSLNNIERVILKFYREGDVPGYLIPRIWLDYLDSRDARPLKGVFYHHAMDILSLAAVAGHLSQRLANPDGPAFHHAEDQISVIRLYYKNKEYASVMEHARTFLDGSIVTDELRRECLSLLGNAAKRQGRYDEMYNAWKILHAEYPADSTGAAELAKFLEHQFRNPREAAQVCRETLDALSREQGPAGVTGDFQVSALRGRLKRLEAKLERRQQPRNGDRDIFFDMQE